MFSGVYGRRSYSKYNHDDIDYNYLEQPQSQNQEEIKSEPATGSDSDLHYAHTANNEHTQTDSVNAPYEEVQDSGNNEAFFSFSPVTTQILFWSTVFVTVIVILKVDFGNGQRPVE